MFRSVSHVRDRLWRWPWLTPLGYQNHPTYQPTTSYNMDENRSCHVKYETFQLWGGSMILNVLEDAWTLGSSVTRHLCGKLIVEHLSNATIWGPFPLHLRSRFWIQPISLLHAACRFDQICSGLYDLVVHGTLGNVRAVVHKMRANNKLARFEVPAINIQVIQDIQGPIQSAFVMWFFWGSTIYPLSTWNQCEPYQVSALGILWDLQTWQARQVHPRWVCGTNKSSLSPAERRQVWLGYLYHGSNDFSDVIAHCR